MSKLIPYINKFILMHTNFIKEHAALTKKIHLSPFKPMFIALASCLIPSILFFIGGWKFVGFMTGISSLPAMILSGLFFESKAKKTLKDFEVSYPNQFFELFKDESSQFLFLHEIEKSKNKINASQVDSIIFQFKHFFSSFKSVTKEEIETIFIDIEKIIEYMNKEENVNSYDVKYKEFLNHHHLIDTNNKEYQIGSNLKNIL